MGVGGVDEEVMIEFAIKALLDESTDPRGIVRDMVHTWAEVPSLALLYTLSMAASAVEHMFSAPRTVRKAQDMWRMIGLVGVDLYTMQCLELPRDTAADLKAFWLLHDPFFLT